MDGWKTMRGHRKTVVAWKRAKKLLKWQVRKPSRLKDGTMKRARVDSVGNRDLKRSRVGKKATDRGGFKKGTTYTHTHISGYSVGFGPFWSVFSFVVVTKPPVRT